MSEMQHDGEATIDPLLEAEGDQTFQAPDEEGLNVTSIIEEHKEEESPEKSEVQHEELQDGGESPEPA
jgi:hypothetical protein